MTIRLEYVKGYQAGWSVPPSITVVMEYIPEISKNAYKTRNGFIKKRVKDWMADLSWILSSLIKSADREFKPPITLRIECEVKGTGRLPDTHNFIIPIADACEDALGINDKDFKVITSPAKRGIDSRIIITVEG